jgi:radical SAM superfamily enzyme YgiQ (UPF0313 family)
MKIAFIPTLVVKSDGTSIPFLPLGILSIMSCLKKEGINDNTHLVDLNCMLQQNGQGFSPHFYDHAAKVLLDADYDLIGFSTNSISFHHIVSIARRIKKQNRKITIIVGGPGPQTPSLAPSILTTFSFIDYLVSGEGEITVPKLIHSIQKGKIPVDLPGVYFRLNGKTFINQPNSFIENLDDLPVPNFDSMKDIVCNYKKSESGICIEQGRGCPFNCSYCSTSIFWRHDPRRKSVFRVIKEMNILNEYYSLDKFYLINDCFNSDQDYLFEFCKGMQLSKKPYTWECSLRVDHLTEKTLDTLWAAGCRAFFTGIESGSERIQRLINKNLNLNRIVSILSYATKKGFHITTSFVIGFPEETREDLIKTIRLHKNLLDAGVKKSNLKLLIPLHGSKLLESGKYQLLLDNLEYALKHTLLLDEHINDIQKYPLIFSPFYFYKPLHVSRKEFIEAETLGNRLNNLYA